MGVGAITSAAILGLLFCKLLLLLPKEAFVDLSLNQELGNALITAIFTDPLLRKKLRENPYLPLSDLLAKNGYENLGYFSAVTKALDKNLALRFGVTVLAAAVSPSIAAGLAFVSSVKGIGEAASRKDLRPRPLKSRILKAQDSLLIDNEYDLVAVELLALPDNKMAIVYSDSEGHVKILKQDKITGAVSAPINVNASELVVNNYSFKAECDEKGNIVVIPDY